MSDSRISFHMTISSEETEEEQKFNADYGYPLRHSVGLTTVTMLKIKYSLTSSERSLTSSDTKIL
jgi:hypothetical protein